MRSEGDCLYFPQYQHNHYNGLGLSQLSVNKGGNRYQEFRSPRSVMDLLYPPFSVLSLKHILFKKST